MDRASEEPPPVMVVVMGPRGSGKTTLIRSLVKLYTGKEEEEGATLQTRGRFFRRGGPGGRIHLLRFCQMGLYPKGLALLTNRFHRNAACPSRARAHIGWSRGISSNSPQLSSLLRLPTAFLLKRYCMYVCMYGHTHSKRMDQPDKVANPARGHLKREK